jgi:ABC-type multidrug transport system ATPase subunit
MTISTSNLGKRFNREWIFCGLNCEFKSGNMYAITGPNGSGKSTLMQVLWGQTPASEGLISYELNGALLPEDEVYKQVTIATPYMDLIEEFTLHEQIDFHFRFKNPQGSLSSQSMIEKLQLGSSANKPIRQFSSGMKQRLKLGLAIFSKSEALFLDEPTTNLDSPSAEWYLNHLIEFSANRLVFIATNQLSDYPKGTSTINLSNLKRVTKGAMASI